MDEKSEKYHKNTQMAKAYLNIQIEFLIGQNQRICTYMHRKQYGWEIRDCHTATHSTSTVKWY